MQLTMFSDLALRMIMRMAVEDDGTRFTAAGVADELHASRAHVSKIVTRLADMGAVTSVKGRGGGIYLADGARDMTVGRILRDLEAGEVVDCMHLDCPMLPACGLRGELARAQEAFFRHLDGVRIGSLVERKPVALGTSIGVRSPL
ncbi:Rrf2 family transcriptional regulator [Corynebacterium sp. 335C]